MNSIVVFTFIFVVFIGGVLIGKMLFKTSANSQKKILEEKNNSLHNENRTFKEFAEQQKKDLQTQITELNSEKKELIAEKHSLAVELSQKETQYNNLKQKNEEQQQELEQLQARFTKEFENLANKILEEKSSKFTKQNQENIDNILKPLKEQIHLFEKKVEDSQKENVGIHSSLKEQLKNIQDQGIAISKEAQNLAKALKSDTKTQGNWGELILERVLEKSGLRKGEEYRVQETFEDPNNPNRKVRPDVTILLSDGRSMIVDSKVSITNYERFVNEEDPNIKTQYLGAHVNSIENHIKELSDKKYQEIKNLTTLDFVLLFIPNDSAFAYALKHKPELWEKAFEKNIIIVTPITILATLKTVNSLWNIQKRHKNAEEIARLAGTLYDKFFGFHENLINIGKKLEDATKEYNNAYSKLGHGKGNAIRILDRIKELGAKTEKSIPENALNQTENTDEPEQQLLIT